MPKLKSPGRHLEGWQLGAVSVSIALLAAAVGVPRAVEPDIFPLPSIDRHAEQRSLAEDERLEQRARREPLPFEVRAVGEALRRLGRTEAADGPHDGGNEVRRLVSLARKRNADWRLLELRAVQSALFQNALTSWERDGHASADLTELGGSFLEQAQKYGWITLPHSLALSKAERQSLFKTRWADLAGLKDVPSFALSMNERRVLYRCLLERPPVSVSKGDVPTRTLAQARLRYVTALAKLDPGYFATLAAGVFHYQLGNYSQARGHFQNHLARHPNGPWTLRARNYLAGVNLRQPPEPPESP